MTVDDEQQELVVKVNNTLKRVGPVSGAKDVAHLAAGHLPPSVQTLQAAHHHTQLHGTDLSLSRGPAQEDGPQPACHRPSPAPSPVALNFSTVSGRKSHGRKGTNPTKVSQQVLEQVNELDSDDDDDEPLTIITPEAPEASCPPTSGPPSPSCLQSGRGPPPACSPPTRYHRAPVTPSGSAKRKPSHQFRVPQYPSPVGSPYVRPLPPVEPFQSEDGGDGSGASSTGRSSASGGMAHQGISLPIYVAGTYSNNDGDDQPMNLAAGSSASNSASPAKQNGLMAAVNGRDSREGSPACPPALPGDRPGSTAGTHPRNDGLHVKDEPDEDSETEYKEQLTSLEEYARANVAALFSGGDGADRDARMEGLHAALPYPALGMYLPRPDYDSPSPSRLDSGDGLTIKYTSTGPYTVGANGKDVSNSSRIKDIIMYDDQSPLSTQKGARIETDYIVDKLGMDGRKRRRRAPEDLLTPEEIAEYLGQPEHSDFNFRCKYCSEEFDSITRYIHHTLAAHQAYICHQCGKSFTTKSSLLRHRPIHTGMRRFACSICKKTFYRKDKCKAHIRRHLGLSSQTTGTPAQDASTSSLVQDAPPLAADCGNSQFPSPVEASSPTPEGADSP